MPSVGRHGNSNLLQTTKRLIMKWDALFPSCTNYHPWPRSEASARKDGPRGREISASPDHPVHPRWIFIKYWRFRHRACSWRMFGMHFLSWKPHDWFWGKRSLVLPQFLPSQMKLPTAVSCGVFFGFLDKFGNIMQENILDIWKQPRFYWSRD